MGVPQLINQVEHPSLICGDAGCSTHRLSPHWAGVDIPNASVEEAPRYRSSTDSMFTALSQTLPPTLPLPLLWLSLGPRPPLLRDLWLWPRLEFICCSIIELVKSW